jgi:hypothetical protein
MYKSDGALLFSHGFLKDANLRSSFAAKSAYKLTETEILTLPREQIQNSRKTFFPIKFVENLAMRKSKADIGAHPPTKACVANYPVWKKYESSNRRIKGNWGQDRSLRWEVLMEGMKAEKERMKQV